MELDKIQFIRALLSDPNLSRVASRFHMTQSALSKRIKAIEIELGFPLFERRGPKGLHPLPHTYQFAELIDQVSGAWKKGIEKMNHGVTGINSFSIIGPQLFIREVFLPWWSKYQEKLPTQIELEVRIPALRIVSLETLKIQADAAIIEKKEELEDYICKKIFSEQWGIARSYTAKNKRLEDLTWGTYAKHSNPVDLWLVQTKKMSEPNYSLYCEDLVALAQWVSTGSSRASVLPEHALYDLIREKKIIFESLGTKALKELFLAYPVKTKYQTIIKAMLEIQKQ